MQRNRPFRSMTLSLIVTKIYICLGSSSLDVHPIITFDGLQSLRNPLRRSELMKIFVLNVALELNIIMLIMGFLHREGFERRLNDVVDILWRRSAPPKWSV
jgi:hypothetical protein